MDLFLVTSLAREYEHAMLQDNQILAQPTATDRGVVFNYFIGQPSFPAFLNVYTYDARMLSMRRMLYDMMILCMFCIACVVMEN